jgi:eukaryotic-like serine/threonine-protein kinase
MPQLNIDTISAPQSVKRKLTELGASICFDKQSRKGAKRVAFLRHQSGPSTARGCEILRLGRSPQFHAEPQNLAALNADNVISVMDAAFVDTDYAYFITPFYERGDLDDELGRGIHENLRAVSMVRDVLSGLSYLHAENLLHRDLKPQNLLLTDDDHAIIGDFGSVKRIPDGQTTVPGSGQSLIYRPPESAQASVYGVTGDIYQVGVLLYQLLGGNLPYEESAWLNSR